MKLIRIALIVFAFALLALTQPDSADIYAGNLLPDNSSIAEDMTLRGLISSPGNSGKIECEQAIAAAINETHKQPDAADLYYKLGLTYFKYGHSGNWDKGVEAFKKAIQLNPNYAESYCKLGEAYDQIHYYSLQYAHPTEERQSFLKAIEIKPDLAEAYVELGRSYLIDNGNMRDGKQAEELFARAIQVNPEYVEAYHALAGACSFQDRDLEALEIEKKALLVNLDKSQSYYSLYEYAARKGYPEDVIETFKETIRQKPDNVDGFRCLGRIYYHQSRYDEAIQAYKEAVRITPVDATLRYELGTMYAVAGDKRAAMTEYITLQRLSKKVWHWPVEKYRYQMRAKDLLNTIQTGHIEVPCGSSW